MTEAERIECLEEEVDQLKKYVGELVRASGNAYPPDVRTGPFSTSRDDASAA